MDYYALDKIDAGMRTAGFIASATLSRPVGGWLADKFEPLFILMAVFLGITIAAIILAFTPAIHLYTVGALMIAFTAGVGNGVIFKLVPFYFNKQAGTANGIVSMMGGLGGFFPPLLLSAIYSLTESYSIGFMAFSQFALVSLVLVMWLYYMDRLSLSKDVFNSTKQGIIVTDKGGKIISVNPAFSKLTGYDDQDVIGENPSILSAGKQDKDFYKHLWDQLTAKGEWHGELWNKKKNGDEYLQFISISALYDASGDVTRYVGTFSDITEQ